MIAFYENAIGAAPEPLRRASFRLDPDQGAPQTEA
jgi:hypothetical protein